MKQIEELSKIRLSADAKRFYNIRYHINGESGSYRLRHGKNGRFGAFTSPVKSRNMHNVLRMMGFADNHRPTFVEDLKIESHFKRGHVDIKTALVKEILKDIGKRRSADLVYSRLVKISDDIWKLPTTVLTDGTVFIYLNKLINKVDEK